MVTGDIRARVQSELSFRVSGRIVERLVDVGAKVKVGDVLARIDAEEQRAEVAVAESNLEAARAQQVQSKLTFERQQSLFETHVTTRALLDAAKAALVTAEGGVTSAQALLDAARDSLSYTELRAGADGIITERNAEVGQVAQAAQSVFSLAHDGPRDAVFDVYEAVFLRGRLEEDISISLLSETSRRSVARIREVSPTIDVTKGTIRVKATLDATFDAPLGAPVVGVFQSPSVNTIELPWSAMSSDARGPAVWIVDPAASTVSLRSIGVADYETGRFYVNSGLKAGELVVSEGQKFLRPGQRITFDQAERS